MLTNSDKGTKYTLPSKTSWGLRTHLDIHELPSGLTLIPENFTNLIKKESN